MDNRGKIVIYQTKDGKTSIDVKLENETVWLNQAQMAELFQTDRTSIVKHVNKSISRKSWRKTELVQKLHKFRWRGIGLSSVTLFIIILI